MNHARSACALRAAATIVAICCSASAARADEVTDWNQVLMQAIRADGTSPPRSSRAMGMVHGAMYDAVNAIRQTHTPYLYSGTASADTSDRAAAATAAHRVLSSLYPAQVPTFDAALASSLAAIPEPGKAAGVALGSSVAAAMISARAGDGSGTITPYTPGTAPGQWRPTPPGFAPALLPNWPKLTPFTMTSGSQFRRAGPPALTSAQYTAAFNEVKELGSATSATRTADQTEIARFWADGGGTETPPGHWNRIARAAAVSQGNTLEENARMFALLNLAEADAAIVSWDMKYEYNFWRPVAAIREADTDGNPDTAPDLTWSPLITTPPFPEYTSGHSTFSGAAADILAAFFGTDAIPFTIGSDGLPGVQRSFSGFDQAALEAGMSRIYGGIHFQFSNEDGLGSGRELAGYIFNNFLLPVPAPSAIAPLAMMALVACRRRRS